MVKSADDNILLLVVLNTLTMVYDDIVSQHNAVDIKTEEARKLKVIIKMF